MDPTRRVRSSGSTPSEESALDLEKTCYSQSNTNNNLPSFNQATLQPYASAGQHSESNAAYFSWPTSSLVSCSLELSMGEEDLLTLKEPVEKYSSNKGLKKNSNSYCVEYVLSAGGTTIFSEDTGYGYARISISRSLRQLWCSSLYEASGSLSSSKAVLDRGVIGLAISLPLCLVVECDLDGIKGFGNGADDLLILGVWRSSKVVVGRWSVTGLAISLPLCLVDAFDLVEKDGFGAGAYDL
nr:hypothetical protein [Tanacetum cinerariifolium]